MPRRPVDPSPFGDRSDVHLDAPASAPGSGRFQVPHDRWPVGTDYLADNNPKSSTGVAQPVELNLFAQYRTEWDDVKESKRNETILRAARLGAWYPGGLELKEFAKSAKTGKVEGAANLKSLLAIIGGQRPRSVTRVNLFTHAWKGYIGHSSGHFPETTGSLISEKITNMQSSVIPPGPISGF